MNINIAIIGAGLMGRLIALSLTRQGYKPTLIDKDDTNARNSAAYAAAGLLTPLGEAMHCEPNIVEMGMESLKLWPELLTTLNGESFFQQDGAIMVSHTQDQGDYLHFARYIKEHYPQHHVNSLNRSQLEALEPDIGRAFNQALFLPEEGQIDNRKLLIALATELEQADIQWLSNTEVVEIISNIENTQVSYKGLDVEPLNNGCVTQTFDLVIDCRGTGAKPVKNLTDNKQSTLSDLRAVRGEVFRLYAPNVNISRPIRLMHPRYQLYIAPKGDGHFAVGATEIESDDMSPMTVRSAMELLSAAYSVHAGFAEAHIEQSISQCRPAFSHNQPQIIVNNQTVHVNGLYRHGYLISPVVLAQVNELINLHHSSGSLKHSDYSHFKYSHLLPIS
ncbi:FAD-dependent oxidoreductase [Pseudocolwellia agarivorans]|uniref:FAD-dependent oxidoreductase n=1 Tax=Pseudocolwellia agarivorans TaxID=1911682 RepID=UPI001FE27D44|nr:FAD-dependent oxidoreductase [Pseudocolwellia agarivorans]